MSLIIRRATREDIPLISALAHEIWPPTYSQLMTHDKLEYMLDLIYSEESLRRQMDNGHEFMLVSDGPHDTGFASIAETAPSAYKLHKIYVLPSQQGKGTGRFIIDHIVKEITWRGANALRLNVKRDNPALHFYEKLGFAVIGEEDIDIGRGYFMEDYIMEKRW